MLLSFSCKNVCVYDEFVLDFLVLPKTKEAKDKMVSKKNFITIKKLNISIFKKIGLIGLNASGKSTLINNFLFYYQLQNFRDLWVKFMQESLNEFIYLKTQELKGNELRNHFSHTYSSNEKQLDSNYIKEISRYNNLHLQNYNLLGIDILNSKEKDFILFLLKQKVEAFFDSHAFNVNKNKMFLNLKFLIKNEIFISTYELNRQGEIKINFYDHNNVNVLSKVINLISLNLNPEDQNQFVFNDWRLEIITPDFEKYFNLSLNNLITFPLHHDIASNNMIFNSIFDYLKINNHKNNFLLWIKIADSLIDDLVEDDRNKIFYFRTKNNLILNFALLSLGTKKWIFLYYYLFIVPSLFLQDSTKIFLFDEIENSFDYKLIDNFFKIINKNKNMQLIFTTLNPYIFDDSFQSESIYLTSFDEKHFKVKRLSKIKTNKNINISKYLKEKLK